MDIHFFLETKNYSDSVKKGGLPFLIKKWQWITNRIPYNNNYTLYEYLNDLLTRNVIEEITTNCELDSRTKEELNEIDKLFEEKTIEIKVSLWSQDMIRDDHNWFYFRVPYERIFDWGIF